ncbi:hypothetical protein NHH03_21925 [Stieleria sp. TO1_6]|uniref:hypothetical protein n=1 Tax=Stieleria tagensis TaxID=2956795 RepID=UPI00209B5F1B|nr:hypothetical protein [Stieleria tagensis]MCO8124414.1 hypothetical protein [Stieleria tagensis]
MLESSWDLTLKISRNRRNYLTALCVMTLCAGAYRVAASQLLKVPKVTIVAPRPPTEKPELKQGLADLFPADAWQRGDCKRLLTSNGALLCKELRQISEDRWRLEPLTIVIGRGLSDDDADAPIVLTAPEGAEIQFAQSLDMIGGNAPPIKMGRMIGDVVIERVNAEKPSEKMRVETQNVRIDNQKVWTTERITMQVGDAELRGRDMTIYLASSAASATKAKTPATILDRMDLVYLEELRIPLNQDSLDARKPRRIGSTAQPADQPTDHGVVSIRCKNGMVYDFALDRLSLRESIVMSRSVEDQVVDRFDCDTLDLVLRDPANRTLVRRSPLDWIDRVRATGKPAMINLSTYDLQLAAESIEFDAVGGLLRAESDTDESTPGASQQGVQIRRGNVQAHLARLAYQFNPDAPKEIGTIDAMGAGLVTINDPAFALRHLQWTEGFNLEPLSRATVDAVKQKQEQSKLGLRIDGAVEARLADGGVIQAGSIEGVLKPHYVDEPTGHDLASTSDSISPPQPETESKLTLIPEVFHASNAVSINSNQILANMNQLSLYFEQAADLANRAPSANLMSGSPGQSRPKPKGILAGLVSQPESTDQLRTPVARPRPTLSGDLVSALLLLTPHGIEAKDLSINGNVFVKHQVESGTQVLPVEMNGDSLRLQGIAASQASGRNYLQLGSGPQSPARLKMGDGFFVGPMIKVWPNENVVQVSGAGELKIPTEMLPTKSRSNVTQQPDRGSKLEWVSAPHCRWGGEMQFDGQYAEITGGVQIDTELINGDEPWTATMTGDAMEIALTHPVELLDRTTMAAAEIATINLVQLNRQPVTVRAEQLAVDQTPKARHLITANRLEFTPGAGGQFRGLGPGWYRGWLLTNQSNSILSADVAVTENRGRQVLQGVHLTFREELQGDLENETLAFTGGVRSGVRKLQSWDEVVDVDQMQRLAVGEMTMDCQRLQFGITPGVPDDLRRLPGMPTPWEMIAQDGVIVRSNTAERGLIQGNASRASYVSKQSRLLIEGSAQRSAMVKQTLPSGEQGFQMRMPRLAINLKTYETEMIMEDAQIDRLPQR